MKIQVNPKAMQAVKKAVVSQRAIQAGKQALNGLSVFAIAASQGYPEHKDPRSGELLAHGATGDEFRASAVEAFGEQTVASLLKAAALFDDDLASDEKPAPVKGAKVKR